jgi:hypothetical protein
MKQYFQITSNGVFKIIAKELNEALSPTSNGQFIVSVLISNSKTCSLTVNVYVHLSKVITQSQCPKISVTSLCEFNINQTIFDSSFFFFFFYKLFFSKLNENY